VAIDSTIGQTCSVYYASGGPTNPWYYPTKFGNPSTGIPLATGVEARLIEAEAQLKDGQVTPWAQTLNTLRANAPSTYVHLASAMPALTADSTTSASATMQVDVMFRERAFWLFGTGTRLGDMRRLLRQYSRSASAVFPTGAYAGGAYAALTEYGPDVSLTLPTPTGGARLSNPYYQGCLTSAATP
jgi:hypothetical protein